jgi:uncharacterized protein YPO0396
VTLAFDDLAETLVLRRIEVYNWGPFARSHRAEIDERGTAIVGPTGSGKTTLVDALMTLIVANPKYNLASTGGHDSDRDLMSYVRGVVGHGNETGDASHVSRPGRTVTGLAATFSRPGRTVILGALLWADGTSMSAADCKKRWIIAEDDTESLEHWLRVHHEGGARALGRYEAERPRLSVFESKKAYLARVRRLFDISENAFDLLNRAAGLKQLDSVDHLFRELVLDDRSAFRRAAQVVEEFDDLVGIRAELETARRQQASLAPLVRLDERHRGLAEARVEREGAVALVGRWFARAGVALWGARLAELDADLARLEGEQTKLAHQITRAQARVDDLHGAYLRAGGADLDQLVAAIDTQRRLRAERERSFQHQAAMVAQLRPVLGLEVDTPGAEPSEAWLVAVQAEARRLRPGLDERRQATEAEFQRAASAVGIVTGDLASARRDLEQIRSRPESNIPPAFQDFRAELAEAVGVEPGDLPFVAELVSVREEERAWRGAIERAIGAHRLRILVPQAQLGPALRWVNGRHNALHVRLEQGDGDRPSGRSGEPFADGFLHKLDRRDHALAKGLWRLLVSIDRHCVASTGELRDTAFALTREGTLSGPTGRFDKHDQRRLGDDWLTGFDNRDQLAALTGRVAELEQAATGATAYYQQAATQRDGFVKGIGLLDGLEELTFDQIDVATARRELSDLEARHQRLSDPASDAGQARANYDEARLAQDDLRSEHEAVVKAVGATETQRDQAARQRGQAEEAAGLPFSPGESELAGRLLPDLSGEAPDRLGSVERECRHQLGARVLELGDELARVGQALVKQMTAAKADDTGELVEVGTDLVDVPAYLERLVVLTEEALPQRQQRFLEYLNLSSDQGVSSLLAMIDAEVDAIVNRISDLNRTLEKVDFQPGRFLQLRPRRVTQQTLQDLVRAQKALAAARFTDKTGEAQYRALQAVIDIVRRAAENKTTVTARALLDARHRLTFSVAVIERLSGATVEIRTSSEGGSGGEKEIIASYILTASLSYALCPDGAAQPLFGTIVLDEAFSKSSQTVAGRIIEALAVFGLHPLFVTPNKEVRLLRANTRSAVVVSRRGQESRLIAVSWEELDELMARFGNGLVVDLVSEVAR